MVKVRQRKGRDGLQVDIRGRLPDGTRYRERAKPPVSTYTAALRWGQQREAAIIAQGGVRPKEETQRPPVPTLAAFRDRFIREYVEANRQKPSAVSSAESILRSRILPVLGVKRLDEIGHGDVQALKASMTDLSPKSVNNTLSQLSRMLHYAADVGLVPEDEIPAIRWVRAPRPSSPAFYGFEEYRRLVSGAEAIDPRIGLLVLLGGDAGLRRGEAIALEWTDLDLGRGTVHVQRSEWDGEVTVPKGGRDRRVPLTAALAETLKAHRHLKGPRVLCHEDGSGIGKTAVHDWMARAQRRAGLEVTGNYHLLRHTFCSHLAMQGAPAKAIQEVAGHADLSTTLRYMHLSPGTTEAVMGLLDRRPRGTSLAPRMAAATKSSEVN